jgi:peptidylprolyl isomerase
MAARTGDTVRVHYTGRLDDGTQFDSSENRDPLEFELGAGQVIPGFESAVEGMEPGQDKRFTIPADDAYGPHRPEMVLEVDRDQVPPDIDPQVGDTLHIQTPAGEPIPVRVTAVDDGAVTLDANHPLAGEDLNFEVRLEEIV